MTPPDGSPITLPAATKASQTKATAKPSGVEQLKASSHLLRGRLAEELAEGGTQVSEDGYNLLKFHGSYEQHDRDTATARKQQGEEKDFSFMLRVRMPGGILTAAQYLALDALADRYGNGSLRITTRQGIQFHGIIKGNLKPTIAEIDRTLLTTQSACGDVVRNVVTTPAPVRDAVHARLEADARMLSEKLQPHSRAYHQIFLDEEAEEGAKESEPLYGPTYLPRKFKIGIATPDDNTIDVLTNDLGFLALFEGDGASGRALRGYNIAVGGGLGMTHNKPTTYPRLGTVIGFVGPDDLLRAAEAVIRLQRDNGNRSDRKRARLKYVVDDMGVDWVRETLAGYFGAPLAPPRPMPPLVVPELLGWHEQGDGQWWLGVPVPSGRISDTGGVALRTALREVVDRFRLDPVMTPQQDVLLSNIAPRDRAAVEAVLRGHRVTFAEDLTPLSRWALACPALPTCGLALTEAERVRGPLVAAFEDVLRRHGVENERISLRITGCPNGCARSYAGDIGLVGRVPGSYAVFLGGDFEGTRLSFKLLERVPQDKLADTLDPIVAAFARYRRPGEPFGGFCDRLGRDALLALAERRELASASTAA
jgi:sulfite reductase (ferredoxin)